LAAGLESLLAMGRDTHHQSLDERFADTLPAPENPTPVEAMAHSLRTPEVKKLYALRKHIPELVFGIIRLAIAARIDVDRLGKERRESRPVFVDALGKTGIGFIHIGQAVMHCEAARVEPAID
jgi:hypothetical protein